MKQVRCIGRTAAGGMRACGGGFTLIELLMVVLVIGVLIGILLPALAGARRNAKRKQAVMEMRSIKTAIVAYHLDNRNWPLPAAELNPAIKPNESYSGDNYLLVRILTNATPPYLDVSHFRFDANGNIVDPWKDTTNPDGRPYVITVDKNHDGSPNQATVQSISPEMY